MENIKFIVKVHRTDWEINLVEPTNENLLMEDGQYHCGVTFYVEKKIYINKELNKQTFDNTLLHELTHAFIESYGLMQIEWQDENVADFVGYYFFDILEKYSQTIEEISEKDAGKKFEKLKKILEEGKNER